MPKGYCGTLCDLIKLVSVIQSECTHCCFHWIDSIPFLYSTLSVLYFEYFIKLFITFKWTLAEGVHGNDYIQTCVQLAKLSSYNHLILFIWDIFSVPSVLIWFNSAILACSRNLLAFGEVSSPANCNMIFWLECWEPQEKHFFFMAVSLAIKISLFVSILISLVTKVFNFFLFQNY